MDFTPNIGPAEIIKKCALGGTCFRDIYSGVNERFIKITEKNSKI